MAKRAIVLVIDRLGASHLGPYGNTLFPTPGFNRLGSTSWLCERAIADSADLACAYRGWLTGRHTLCPAATDTRDLCQRLAEREIGTSLITDEPAVSELAAGYAFGEMSELPATPPRAPAEEVAATQTAEFFSALLEGLAELPESHLLWAHARGLAGPWDAPPEMRELLTAADDPAPYAGLTPPRRLGEGEKETDPQTEEQAERWPIVCSHAAQLLVIDACLETLLDALESAPGETLLIVTSPRGFPLGEHGAVGESAGGLHEELLHVPLFIRHPGGAGAAARGPHFAQPADLAATLLAWFEGEPLPASGGAANLMPHVLDPSEAPPVRERAVAVNAATQAAVLHTPHWCWHGKVTAELGADPLAAEGTGRLYVKPDDRWEVNEIADRCPQIVTAMQADFVRFAQLAAAGNLQELPALTEELREMTG